MSVTDWRGRLQEEQDPNNDNLPIDESIPLRREARSLLISLLRPYRWIVAVLALVVIVENAARLAGSGPGATRHRPRHPADPRGRPCA